MTIQVLFFAGLRERFGERELRLELSSPHTVKGLAERLEHDYQLSLEGALVAVNEHYVSLDYLLVDGDVLALFPPVAGG